MKKAYKWNPWIGCHKKSEGCKNCPRVQRNNIEYLTTIRLDLKNFDLPLQRDSKGQYYIKENSLVSLQYSGDFFIQDMDFIRSYLWDIIKIRSDCYFFTTTKRPERIEKCLPKDWHNGWDNIDISCTIETQNQANKRLPIYLQLPLKKYKILAMPLLEEINFSSFFPKYQIDYIGAGGEYAVTYQALPRIRKCTYQWVNDIAKQCKKNNIKFSFINIGSNWIDEKKQQYPLSIYDYLKINKTKKYNLSTANLLDLPQHEFIYINKEENNQGQE